MVTRFDDSLPTRSHADLAADGECERDEDDNLQVGDTIGTHYRIRGVLGSGGMGTVYLARDEHLDRDVAIKRVHDDKLSLERIRAGFTTEARAMARVHHRNVVTIFAFGDLQNRPYFVMEHVPGHNLAMWHRMHDPLTTAAAMAILDPLCRGVQAIHDAGALHRDLKPSNVLIGPCQRVAVADFGLALSSDQPESWPPGVEFVGTPAYLAPEIARADPIVPDLAPRIDVYALGVIAYELLTGGLPFRAVGLPGLLAQHAYNAPPSPLLRRPDLAEAFEAPLLRALAKEPADRTPTADALRDELQHAFESSSRPPPTQLQILVADDDLATLSALRELLALSFPGAEIATATDAASAFAIAKHLRPDIVITDLHMPHGGGEALTSSLRGNPETEDIPSIVVTAYGGAPDWRKLKAIGADRFLVKPIDFDTLVNLVRSLTDPPGSFESRR